MRVGRWVRGIIAALLAASLSSSSFAAALSVSPPPVEYYPPLFITAFQTSRSVMPISSLDDPTLIVDVPTDLLAVVELHSDISDPINLNDWSVEVSDEYGLICTISLSGWLLPDDYVVMASSTAGLADSTGNVRLFDPCVQEGRTIRAIALFHNGEVEEQLAPSQAGAWVRKNTTKTYRSGEFSKDFEAMDEDSRTSFYAGRWYIPLVEPAVRISELLPRARNCSPLETAVDCADYIKLFNPTGGSAILDGLRLRVGYQGQASTTSNTLVIGGTLPAGHYATFATRSDGSPLSIAKDGGWLWLEDSYGIMMYDTTVVAYPSAGSVTKIGWAWAYNDTTGQWQWTSTPTPSDQPSIFTQPLERPSAKAVISTLQPCRSDQYRNPLTNRCKSLSSTSSSLAACEPDQFRNPETNRCKSLTSATSDLKPCASNQVRNPETNRCRTVAAVLAAADFPLEKIPDAAENTIGWWAFASVGSLAVGYAGWEWRKELASMMRMASSLFRR
ncbi:hypothetical protein RAAC3_TM7C00001G0183 [Candidatus Saccharibacteria bacterium RAAC3_TM7_1]|nr:hypothetical protein RAAC3_TM7C00001G0183 [Candidatus Saccharibacteria bacterium RAAC3_TM7_1]HCZ28778.1 hypothetical protein [Candidatus Saccharibacteria bacterium]